MALQWQVKLIASDTTTFEFYTESIRKAYKDIASKILRLSLSTLALNITDRAKEKRNKRNLNVRFGVKTVIRYMADKLKLPCQRVHTAPIEFLLPNR